MLENALVYRHWHTAFRARKLIAFLGALAAILITAYTASYSHFVSECQGWIGLGKAMLQVVSVLELLVCIYGSFALCAESIGGERIRKTLDLLVTLPLRPAQKVHGLLIGCNLYPLLGYVLLTPLLLVFGTIAGVAMSDLLIASGLVLAFMLCYSLVGLAISSAAGGILSVLAAVLLFIVSSGLDGALFHDAIWDVRNGLNRQSELSALAPLLPASPASVCEMALQPGFTPPALLFFGQPIPWQVATLIGLAYLSVLSYLVARQKLSRPSLPPLPRGLTLLFFALLEALLIGFFWRTDFSGIEPTRVWLAAFFMLLLLWSVATQLTYPRLLEWTRRYGARPLQMFTQVFRLSSPNALLVLLMWFLVADGLWVLRRNSGSREEAVAAILAFVSLLGFLLQANVLFLLGEVFWKRAGKAGGLAMFLVLTVIPLAIGLAAENKTIVSLSAPYALALLDPKDFNRTDIVANLCAGWGFFALFSVIYLYWSISTAWLAKREAQDRA